MGNAYIRQGGKVRTYDTTTGKVKEIKKETVNSNDTSVSSVQANKAVQDNTTTISKKQDIVGYCKESVYFNSITPATAANCIVGNIRAIYFNSLSKPIGYDLEILNYMDKILFNTLASVIEGIIRFGSETVNKDLIKEIISNAIKAVEFQTDTESIYKVIDRIYEEF